MRCRAWIVVLMVVAGPGCGGDPAPSWEIDLRRDLVLDAERVELGAGFDDRTVLRILGDVPRVNRDRAEVALTMPRTGHLRWHVDARPGRFVAGVTRLRVGPEDDASPARVTVSAYRGTELVAQVEVAIPPAGVDLAAAPKVLREGAVAPVVLELPQGADVLDIAFDSQGDPTLGYLALLSPRVEQQPLHVAVDDHPLRFEREQRLASRLVGVAPASVVFATRSDDLVTDEPVRVAAAAFLGSFEGHIGRRALVLTGETRVEAQVDIAPGAVLRGDLGLDDRLPRDTLARLVVSVDGSEVFAGEVHFGDWQPLAVPLDDFVGVGRRVAFELSAVHFQPAPIVKEIHDYDRQAKILTTFVAREVRLGIADPRLATPVEVARRVASAAQPSVLLLHVETLRADVLPGFGGELADLAPNLARLVRCATTYETAIAPSPWTLPSTSTLFTGLPPSAHGVVRYNRSVLPDEVPTLAELARQAGVVAGAVVANPLLRPDAGFSRGFAPYVELKYRNARQVNDVVQALLANQRGQQFLTFVHYYDPHHPVDAPGAWRERYVSEELVGGSDTLAEFRVWTRLTAGQPVPTDDPDVRLLRERYLGEIAWFDAQLGELLAFLDEQGLAATTCVVLTADHGEEFLEHGLLGHGSNMFDETLRVPLIIAEPGALVGWAQGTEAGTGRTVSGVVGNGGLFAELLSRLDVPFDAESVLPRLTADSGELAVAIAETENGMAPVPPGVAVDPKRRPLRAVRSDDHLLVWYLPVAGEEGDGNKCFYDLRVDPGARNPTNVVGPEAEYHWAALEAALDWSAAHRAAVPDAALDASMHGKLRALGYLNAPGGFEPAPCDG